MAYGKRLSKAGASAYRRSKRTYNRFKKTAKAAKGKYRTHASVVKMPTTSAFPPSMLVKLKYTTENINLTSPTTNFMWHTFSTNSLFDPDWTGIGHQPRLRDQLAVIYNKYRVWGCNVKVSGFCSSNYAIMGAGTRPYSTAQPVNVLDADEIKNYATWQVSGQRPIKYKRYVKNPLVLGVTKANYAGGDQYEALMATNPLVNTFFDVGIASPDGGGSSGSCSIRVELIYYCTVNDPKLIPIS